MGENLSDVKPVHLWGVIWDESSLKGSKRHRHLMLAQPEHEGWLMFPTRKAAKAFIDRHYRYLKGRTLLRNAPYFWRLPKPVRITIRVE